eukprot:1939100-Pleurochrysis_carterae.AAC.1
MRLFAFDGVWRPSCSSSFQEYSRKAPRLLILFWDGLRVAVLPSSPPARADPAAAPCRRGARRPSVAAAVAAPAPSRRRRAGQGGSMRLLL